MLQNPSIFLQTSNVSKTVMSGENDIAILSDVNLNIQAGETVAILGASGSGKTTLLTLLAGLDLPTTGDIYFQSIHLSKISEERRAEIRRKYMGFIFQSFFLIPSLTALENVMLPMELQYIKTSEAMERSIHWLTKVGLNQRLHHYPAVLSGGEQQRVAIARAFIMEPNLIFADEMTGNLDTQTGSMICNILFDVNKQQNTTLVLVTHDNHLAERCDRKLYLEAGCLHENSDK